MANFSSTERFRVSMVNSDGGSERVTVQLSLEGLKILNQDGSRTMRSYNLRNVSSWDLMDTSTVIWTKSDVDLEERALTLSGDSTTIRNVVDTLASCCMQLAEVIRDKEEGRHLEELAAGGGKTKKAAKLPSVDSVEYWRAPDKAGWLQSQSEVMKMWRKRWFVLKQGYLFRFLTPDVSESVKPRGVVDLSKVQDVKDGRSVTGKANSIQLKTASGGSVCYVCDSETEMVEWISALEGSIAKIVKQLAGVDDSSDGHHSKSSSRDKHRSGSSRNRDSGSDWAKQVERSLSQGTSSSSRRGGSTMVQVVNYAGGGSGGVTSGSGGGGRASAPYDDYGISSYSQISGIAGVASAMDDLTLNYGGYQGAGGSSGAAGGGYGSSGAAGGGYGSVNTPYGSAPAYGGSSGGYGAYGGSSAAPGGYDSSSYGYGSSGAAAGGYGGSSAAAAAGPPQYGQAAAPGYDDHAGGYGPPAANGYGSYTQQQQQQPPQQQQQAAYGASPGPYGGQAGYYQQPPQQQQPQQQPQQPAVSLIDQVPAQQPAYPYYQYPTDQGQAGQPDAAAAAAAPAPAAAAPPAPAAGSVWQVHHTAEGRAYYYNSSTGVTQWEVPPGM